MATSQISTKTAVTGTETLAARKVLVMPPNDYMNLDYLHATSSPPSKLQLVEPTFPVLCHLNRTNPEAQRWVPTERGKESQLWTWCRVSSRGDPQSPRTGELTHTAVVHKQCGCMYVRTKVHAHS